MALFLAVTKRLCNLQATMTADRLVRWSARRTMGQDVFVAAYSMYLQANTMTTHPLVPHGTLSEVLELRMP